MPKSFATIMTEAAQDLQDTAGTIWGQTLVTGELPLQLERSFKEVSDYKPYIRKLSLDYLVPLGYITAYTNPMPASLHRNESYLFWIRRGN